MRRSALVLLALGCSSPMKMEPPPPPKWSPGQVYRTERAVNARGFLDRKGLVHAHSIYSHDACDGKPHDGGVYNEECLADFRRDICTSKHDFVFLSDHGDSFRDNPFPDVLLHRATLGDTLVTRGSGPTANQLACPGADPVLIMAGTETATMPVGLERHLDNRALYSSMEDSAINAAKDAGAVALVAHTEDWTPEQLISMPLDGFEMYNLHRNSLQNIGIAAELVFGKVELGDFDGLPHPDAFFTAFTLDDPTYFSTWGTVFARGTKRVTTMGTDCHRNSFPQKLQDGERIDSYRRMMIMFGNHLLVRPNADGSFDDRSLKEALRARRLYGTFDFLGSPEGFDFFASEGTVTKEMGDTTRIAAGTVLEVKTPRVRDLDPAAPAPTITTKLFRAKEGGWDEVASTTEPTLRFVPSQPGAYRAEVRIVPTHLRPFIGKRNDFIRADRPWVMANAIWVE
ncbi:MAG: hypothetical protein ABTQ32_38510 [Myxococcaceae bacterium]